MRALALILISLLPACFGPETASDRSLASLAPSAAQEDPRARFRRPERIPYPKQNRYSKAKYDLGKTLFFDPRLSKSGMMSCASCHNPSLSWTDGLPKAVGHGHKELARKAPTILNAAWGKTFFWDGRAATLEEQALGPIQSPDEMNMPLPELVKKIQSIAEYEPLFKKAFPKETFSEALVAKAIATFERTIVSDIAPFDVWVAGDESAISESAKRGFTLFNGKAACVRCHTGWNFTNGQFADVGLVTDDKGRGIIAGDTDVDFAFKTPTLRNISRRAPYMHDGSLADLATVIDNYDRGGRVQREGTKLFLKPLGLTDEEKQDLIAFLETLTSQDEVISMPALPRGEQKEKSWVSK